MIKLLSIGWLVLALVACGIDYNPNWAVEYIERFNQEGSSRGCYINARNANYEMVDEFSIPKIDQVEHAIGYCMSNGTIEILKSWWNNVATETQKEMVMFHEMGHCVLHLRHTKTGLMQPSLMSDSVYNYNRKALLDQLFKGCL